MRCEVGRPGRHQVPVAITDGAAVVGPLADDQGERGATDERTHLIGDAGQGAVEHLEQDRVAVSKARAARCRLAHRVASWRVSRMSPDVRTSADQPVGTHVVESTWVSTRGPARTVPTGSDPRCDHACRHRTVGPEDRALGGGGSATGPERDGWPLRDACPPHTDGGHLDGDVARYRMELTLVFGVEAVAQVFPEPAIETG